MKDPDKYTHNDPVTEMRLDQNLKNYLNLTLALALKYHLESRFVTLKEQTFKSDIETHILSFCKDRKLPVPQNLEHLIEECYNYLILNHNPNLNT